MATQPDEQLSESELQDLAKKLRQQGEWMSPRDRLLASEAVKSGLQAESDDVQGYGMLVSVLDEQIASTSSEDAEQLTEQEFQAFQERLADLTLEFSPKERSFMARAFRNGVMAAQADDVQGYFFTQYSSTVTIAEISVAEAATSHLSGHECPDGEYWDSYLNGCYAPC